MERLPAGGGSRAESHLGRARVSDRRPASGRARRQRCSVRAPASAADGVGGRRRHLRRRDVPLLGALPTARCRPRIESRSRIAES